MSRPKILITHPNVPSKAIDLLKENCDLIINQEAPPTKDEIKVKAKGVDAIFWIAKLTLDASVLDAAGPQLKVICTMSSGINHIDVATIKARGIKLGNTPVVVNNSVADLAIMLALSVCRRTIEGRKAIINGEWDFGPQWMLGSDLSGSIVGIVGFGGIGQGIAKRLKGFEVNGIMYTGHHRKPQDEETGAKFVDLDTLLKECDFIIASCPLTDETRGMFNSGLFKRMKRNAIFINVARGEVVNQDDLVKALQEKVILGAGLDVMYPEPLPKDHVLLTLDNCVILPHMGTATQSTRDSMAVLCAKNILRALAGEEMLTPIC